MMRNLIKEQLVPIQPMKCSPDPDLEGNKPSVYDSGNCKS